MTIISFESGALWAHNQVQIVLPSSGDGILRLRNDNGLESVH